MKKIISRILSLTIILALTLCLVACGENKENTDTKPAAATETANVTNTPEEPEKNEETAETEDENTEEPQDETPKTEDSDEEGTQHDKVTENTDTDESKVSDYVKNNGSTLTSRLETELSAKNIASTCTVSASGTRLVFTCKLSDYNDLSESDKSKIKIATIALKPTANSELAKITETEPAVTGADFKICETDGDLITTISVSK